MFARFKTPDGSETNVNTSLVRNFVPGTVEGTAQINYLGGESEIVLGSCRTLRHAFKKAIEAGHAGTTEDEPDGPAVDRGLLPA